MTRTRVKFTNEELEQIYRDWVAGKILKELGEEYNVSLQTIWRAINKYESTLPPEQCMTKDEMKARRAKIDKERRMRAVRNREASGSGRRAVG